jgi:putative endopeptidase
VKRTIIGATALLILAACGKQAVEPAVVETPKEPNSGIELANMDKTIRPGDDFFKYVNGAWLDATEIPADKARYGAFDILRDESQESVKVIIEESATGDFAKGSDEQKVGDLYNSFLDTKTRDGRGIAPLQPELDRIDAISNYDELAV